MAAYVKKAPLVPKFRVIVKKVMLIRRLPVQFIVVVMEAAYPRTAVGNISLHTVQGVDPMPGA